MALPLLLPLLGLGAAAGVGAAKGRQRRQDAANILQSQGMTGPRAGMQPEQQSAAFDLLSSPNPEARQLGMQQVMPPDPMAQAKLQGQILQNQIAQQKLNQGPAPAVDPAQFANIANTIRDDREAALAPFNDRLIAGDRALTALRFPTGPASFGALIEFVKTFDPNSVVRQEEGRTLIESSGVMRGFADLWNREALQGGMFSLDTRIEMANMILELQKQQHAEALRTDAMINERVGQMALEGLIPASRSFRFREDRTFELPELLQGDELPRNGNGPSQEELNDAFNNQ